MPRAIRTSSRFIGLLALLLVAVPVAEAQEYIWAKQLSGANVVQAWKVALDSSGNIYTVGRFEGTADFDPGPATANLTSAGDKDIFLSKLDSAGNHVWALQMGGTGDDRGRGVVVDDSGNIYVTGYFTGTADVDPGPGTHNLVSAGSKDIFVARLDPDANLVWVSQGSGTSGVETFDITLDDSANVFTAGLLEGTADFDPGAGTANLISAGGWEAFVWKLDASGNYVWAVQAGGASQDIAVTVDADSDGNVYAGGAFGGTVDFDPGVGTYNLTAGGPSDPFIWKLSSAGNLLWARQINGSLGFRVRSLILDGEGNVYATGDFQGTADFDPGSGAFPMTSVGANDSYVVRLDSAGDFVWARQLGGPATERSWDVGLDSAGAVYTVGQFQGTADFDPGPGALLLTSAGATDVYVSRLDADGDFLSGLQIGGPLGEVAYGVAVNWSGRIHTVGYFEGTADFDPGPGTAGQTAASQDVFISKLGVVPCVLSPFPHAVLAQDESSLIWTASEDVTAVRGPISAVSTYTTTGASMTDVAATTLDISTDNPGPGNGLYYVVRLTDCGSWQTTLDTEPGRDSWLP